MLALLLLKQFWMMPAFFSIFCQGALLAFLWLMPNFEPRTQEVSKSLLPLQGFLLMSQYKYKVIVQGGKSNRVLCSVD